MPDRDRCSNNLSEYQCYERCVYSDTHSDPYWLASNRFLQHPPHAHTASIERPRKFDVVPAVDTLDIFRVQKAIVAGYRRRCSFFGPRLSGKREEGGGGKVCSARVPLRGAVGAMVGLVSIANDCECDQIERDEHNETGSLQSQARAGKSAAVARHASWFLTLSMSRDVFVYARVTG